MRWAVVTSNHVRHRFLVNALADRRDVVVVVAEPKKQDPATCYNNEEERLLLARYFEDRAAAELELLPEGKEWSLPPTTTLMEVPLGGINEARIVSDLQEANVDACVVFGSSILKGGWMEAYGGRMLNIHLGLSPYYRGSGTNLWPLYDGLPELVGATLHQISAEVDAGDVYCQVRPTPSVEDTPHSLGNRTIRKAAAAMAWLMEQFEAGTATASPLPPFAGSVKKTKDFSAEVLRVVLMRFERGMMAEYCQHQMERRRAYPLINEWESDSF